MNRITFSPIHLFLQKVFPETAAMTNGPKQDDAFDLPSDDLDDNDFDPNMPEEHVASKEEGSSEEEEDDDGGSDSDDSDFLTCSNDLEPLIDKKKVDDLGLPSEDSEDDDYDPAGPDSDKDVEKKSNSDESDFTSDSDDFCKEIKKSGGLALQFRHLFAPRWPQFHHLFSPRWSRFHHLFAPRWRQNQQEWYSLHSSTL
jgi:hypothetical protein